MSGLPLVAAAGGTEVADAESIPPLSKGREGGEPTAAVETPAAGILYPLPNPMRFFVPTELVRPEFSMRYMKA